MIQISRAATVERIGDDAEFRVAHGFEIYQLTQSLEVGVPGINLFKSAVICLCGGALSHFGGSLFNIVRYFGERRAAVGSREFQALIFRWVVARSEVDGAIDFPAYYFVRDNWRWSGAFAEQHVDPMFAQNLRGCL